MSQLVGLVGFGTKIILVVKKVLIVKHIWTISKKWSFAISSIRKQHIVCETTEGPMKTH